MKAFASADSSRKFASSDRLGSSECMYLPSKVLFKQSQAVAALRAISSNPAATFFCADCSMVAWCLASTEWQAMHSNQGAKLLSLGGKKHENEK